jgi:hypothetical protein
LLELDSQKTQSAVSDSYTVVEEEDFAKYNS